MGAALILMLLEAGRRALGPILPLITIVTLIYAYIGPHLGGILYHEGLSFVNMVDLSAFTMGGIFTIPVRVCSTYIILFVMFGAFIQVSGAGGFLTRLGYAMAGKSRGGPGKAAVIGSGFIGSITGSAAANIAVTGAVTIPIMKSVGFKPHVAGAIEAATSNGGQILPPVMGGIAFIMMEFLGISYWEICLAAFIPAILYEVAIFYQVHLHSVKHGIPGSKGAIPQVKEVLKEGAEFFLPFIFLIGVLVYGFSPIRATLLSIPVVLVVTLLRKKNRMRIKYLFSALERAVMIVRLIMLACALCGIVMGVIFYTGIGSDIVAIIRGLAGESLWVPVLMAAAVSFLTGMVASPVSAYVLCAILVVPATVGLGVPPLAAHLFSVYFASIAIISPPVGAGFYQAAAMAGAEPFPTGWRAVGFATPALIVAFAFVFNPALLLMGSFPEIIKAIFLTLMAICIIGTGVEGWFLKELNIFQRALLIIGGFLFAMMALYQIIAGAAITISVLLWQWIRRKR